MADVLVGTSSTLVIESQTGTNPAEDIVSIRLVDNTKTVYIELDSAASTTTSFFITGSEVFSCTLRLGQKINAIASGSPVHVRVFSNPRDTFGPSS